MLYLSCLFPALSDWVLVCCRCVSYRRSCLCASRSNSRSWQNNLWCLTYLSENALWRIFARLLSLSKHICFQPKKLFSSDHRCPHELNFYLSWLNYLCEDLLCSFLRYMTNNTGSQRTLTSAYNTFSVLLWRWSHSYWHDPVCCTKTELWSLQTQLPIFVFVYHHRHEFCSLHFPRTTWGSYHRKGITWPVRDINENHSILTVCQVEPAIFIVVAVLFSFNMKPDIIFKFIPDIQYSELNIFCSDLILEVNLLSCLETIIRPFWRSI